MAESFTNSEYTDMHWVYAECGGNSRAAVRRYMEKFPYRRVPHHSTFAAIHRRLREKGTFTAQKMDTGRQRFVNTVQNEEAILNMVEENPNISTRKVSLELGISKNSVHRALKQQLLYPYHVQKVQNLLPADMLPRRTYSQWVMDRHRRDPLFCSRILFTDEATFSRDGILNIHNTHEWAAENPGATREIHFQHKFKINVWAGIMGDTLIGPVMLPNRLGGEEYLEFLQETLPPLLEHVPLNLRATMWFMHDGAPPHFTLAVRQFLNRTYSGRWIGRGEDAPVCWPPRSPDHNPLDFFFWGCLKTKVYVTPVTTREELWQRILRGSNEIRQSEYFWHVQRTLVQRARACIRANGSHFENLLK